jgi:hypothetical protein
MRYLTRELAAAYLTDRGVPATSVSLANLASDGGGPRYGIINHRAVYTAEWLDQWMKEQAERPVPRRRAGRDQPVA